MKIFLVILVLIVSECAVASEEEIATWRHLEVATEAIPHAGRLRARATSDGNQIAHLELEAFGRRFSIPEQQLQEIAGFPLSSLALTHEAGYNLLGGYSVHIKFRRAYYDH